MKNPTADKVYEDIDDPTKTGLASLMTNPTEAPMANAIDDVKEWVLVPRDITPDMQQALIENSGKTTATIWVNLLAAAPSPAPSQHTGWSDEAVSEALRKLAAEVGGLRTFEGELRAEIGNTNYSVLMLRLAEADAALAASSIAPATGFEVKAQTYPKLRQVRAHKPSCANVQVGSTYADKCDCGALDTAGRAIDISPSVAKESWEP